MRAAARYASLLWGGVYHPLIPVVDEDQASRLIGAYRPDVLCSVVSDPALTTVMAAHPHLSWPRALEFFEGTIAPRADELPFLDARFAMRALEGDIQAGGGGSSWQHVVWAEADPEAALFAVLFGEYTHTEYVDCYLEALSAGRTSAGSIPLTWRLAPLGVTSYGLQGSPGRGSRERGVFLGESRDADDLAVFWNLRASGADVAFWPARDPGLLNRTAVEHVERLVASGREGESILLWSRFFQIEIPEELAAAIGSEPHARAVVDSAARFVPRYEYLVATPETGVLGVVEDDGYGTPRLSVALPASPFGLMRPEPLHEQLLVRVALRSAREEDDYTLRLPNLPDLNDSYDRALTLIRTGVRVGDEAVSVFVTPRDSSVAIRLAERSEIVREVFGRAAIAATPSAAGRAADVVAQQLGGLQGLRVLRPAGVRVLLSTPKWRNGQAALGEIKRSGLPDLEHWSEGDVLTALLERRALVSALKIQCPRCQMHARYGLDLISEEMRCPRCRNVFAPAPLLYKSTWEYTASGFFADEDAQGAVPVLLTMLRLGLASSAERFVLSNHDLVGEEVECESDLLVLEQSPGGRIAVAVGECKTRGEVDQNDVDKLARVADHLHRSGVECYLIFSTLREAFSPAEIARFRAYGLSVGGQPSFDVAAHENWNRPGPILFTPRELEHWEIYGLEDDGALPFRYPLSLRDLAANSAARYLNDAVDP